LHDIVRGATAHRSIELSLTAEGQGPTPVVVRDTVRRIHGDTVVRIDFVRPGPKAVVGAAIELAALVLTDPARAWEALVVCRAKAMNGKPVAERLRPHPGPNRVEAARTLLSTALALHLRALREPLPLFERSSKTLFEKHTIDDEEYGRDLRSGAAQFVWGVNTADDILAMPVRTVDELALISNAATGRAQALADVLWGAIHAFVDQSSVDGSPADAERTA
jgi:hypothetical protein